MEVLVFLLLVVAAVVFGVACGSRSPSWLIPLGLTLATAAFALERLPF